jgi:26S proteasome regulatory subunit N13
LSSSLLFFFFSINAARLKNNSTSVFKHHKNVGFVSHFAGQKMIPPPTFSKQPLLQFRAGKMKYANGIVTAEKRKGYVSFFPSGPNAVELVWGSNVEISPALVLPRGKTSVKFVEQCKTGRVLLFEISENGEKRLHFYWLQEKSEEKDSAYLASLVQLLAERPPTTNKQTVALEDFKKILANVSKNKKDIKLSDILSSSIVTEELTNEPALYQAKLAPHLPQGVDSSSDFVSQVKNPQVSQAAAVLQAALQDPPTYKQLCASFGVPETGATGGVLAFLNGIIKASKDGKN